MECDRRDGENEVRWEGRGGRVGEERGGGKDSDTWAPICLDVLTYLFERVPRHTEVRLERREGGREGGRGKRTDT